MNRSKNDNKIRVCEICEEKKTIKNYAKLGRGYSRVCRQCSSGQPAKTTVGRKISFREYYAKKLVKVEGKTRIFARAYKSRKTNMITSSFLMNKFGFSNSYIASYYQWCKRTGRELPLIL